MVFYLATAVSISMQYIFPFYPRQIYCFENAVYYEYYSKDFDIVKVFYLRKSLLMPKYMSISFLVTINP